MRWELAKGWRSVTEGFRAHPAKPTTDTMPTATQLFFMALFYPTRIHSHSAITLKQNDFYTTARRRL
jgi:hypothetical protein